MPKTLIIFETKKDILSYLKKKELDASKLEQTYILAIEADAKAYLKKKKIIFLDTTDFFTKESHEQLILKTCEITEYFRKNVMFADRLGIKEGYNNAFIFYLRHFSVLYILWLIEVLDNAVLKIRPDKIEVVKYDMNVSISSELDGKDTLLGVIAKAIIEKYECRGEILLVKDRVVFFKKKVRFFFSERVKKIIYFINFFFFRIYSYNKKIILLSSEAYNLKSISDQFLEKYSYAASIFIYKNKSKKEEFKKYFFEKRYWNLFSSIPSCIPHDCKCFSNEYMNILRENLRRDIPKNKKIFCFKGIDFSEPLLTKIEKSIIPLIERLEGETYYLDRFLKKVRPALVISQMARGLMYNLGELAGKYNIPSLLVSHGSHVVPNNEYEKIEWGELAFGLIDTAYKYVAIQSPVTRDYFNLNKSESVSITTGPLIFSKLEEGNRRKVKKDRLINRIIPLQRNKTILIHAGTPKHSQGMRPYVFETIDEYIKNINSLISCVNLIKETHLIVRFRPTHKLTLEDFKELLLKSDCFTIHTEGKFQDFLYISDILISYSSTTIEEALLNKIPVVLYDPSGKYCHIKGAEVITTDKEPDISSCYFVNKEESLMSALQSVISHHKKDSVPEFIWEKYIFSVSEKEKLSNYFKGSFKQN